MSYFSMGYWLIGLSVAVSVFGTLVGFTCIRQSARSLTTRFRVVWQVSAAISIGGVGVWLPVFVSMLGLTVRGSLIRYDVLNVTGAAAVSVLGVWAALAIAGPTLRVPRLVLAGLVMGGGFGLMHFLALNAIRIQGSTEVQPLMLAGAVAIAVAISLASLWFTRSFRPLSALVGAAVVFAAGVMGLHFTDLVGLESQLSMSSTTPPGKDLFGFFVPVFVVCMLSLAIPISAILIAPDRRTVVPARIVKANSTF